MATGTFFVGMPFLPMFKLEFAFFDESVHLGPLLPVIWLARIL